MYCAGSAVSNTRVFDLIPITESDGKTRYQIYPQGNQLFLQDSTAIVFYRLASNSSILLDNDYDEGNGTIGEITHQEWLEIIEKNPKGLSSAFKIKWLKTANDTLTFYKRASFVNRGYPQDFLSEIDSNAGPATGWPNIPYFASKLISAKTLVEEIHDEISYVMKTFEEATNKKEYDLIYVDYPIMDRFGHGLLGEDPSIFKSMFDQMDLDFTRFEQFSVENNYELIITSGHGFSPIHTSIDLNQFLKNNGIETDLESAEWEAVGIPGKVSAHVYINPETGPNERKVLLNKISGRFRGMVTEKTRDSIVEEIFRRAELKEIGLDHSNAGDLFILLKPGYVFANAAQPSIFEPSIFRGDHGYSLKHEDSHGFVYSSKKCDPCETTYIADQVLETLGVE